MKHRRERVRGGISPGVEWSKFRKKILEVREEMCGTRIIGEGMRIKGSEW